MKCHAILVASKKQYNPTVEMKPVKYCYLGTVINKGINCFGYVVRDLLACVVL